MDQGNAEKFVIASNAEYVFVCQDSTFRGKGAIVTFQNLRGIIIRRSIREMEAKDAAERYASENYLQLRLLNGKNEWTIKNFVRPVVQRCNKDFQPSSPSDDDQQETKKILESIEAIAQKIRADNQASSEALAETIKAEVRNAFNQILIDNRTQMINFMEEYNRRILQHFKNALSNATAQMENNFNERKQQIQDASLQFNDYLLSSRMAAASHPNYSAMQFQNVASRQRPTHFSPPPLHYNLPRSDEL